MCIEDVRMGNRRWYRFTFCAAGGLTTIRGDGNRVGLMFSAIADGGTTVNCNIQDQATASVILPLYANQRNAELWIYPHGLIVKQAITVTPIAATSPVYVTEILQANQEFAPDPDPSFTNPKRIAADAYSHQNY